MLKKLSRPRFFPGFDISRSYLHAKQVGKKGKKFQKPEKIVVLKVVLIFFPSSSMYVDLNLVY